MAVGLAFALAATGEPGALTAAFALALGMGLQNFPEGAAISLPLHREGLGRGKAFFYGAASGFVEPVAGLIDVYKRQAKGRLSAFPADGVGCCPPLPSSRRR